MTTKHLSHLADQVRKEKEQNSRFPVETIGMYTTLATRCVLRDVAVGRSRPSVARLMPVAFEKNQ